MSPLLLVLTVLAALALIALICVAVLYNRFVQGRNNLKEAWSGIDVQLKRRFDLIPNLVEIVKGYASHEKGVFEEVSRLRGQIGSLAPADRAARLTGENAFSQQLRNLLVVAEAYPNLKADANFRDLQNQLVEVEEQLQYARRYYNGSVRDYNVSIQSFPGNLFAGLFHFLPADFFEIESATERQAPKVEIAG